jgi:hypothetical protein
MRSVLFGLILLTLLMTACASAASTEPPSIIIERPEPTPALEDPVLEEPTEQPTAGPAEEAVMKQLAAHLRLRESDISLLSSEEVEFGDACLDVLMEGVLCAQVVTPGRVIVLEAQGVPYEYHTNEDGSRIQPATLALIWKREGGIAGFCDTLTVFRSGEVYSSQCSLQSEGRMGTFAELLSARERAQFSDWIAEFAETDLDASDPKGVADRMVVTLKLFGAGDKPPTQSEQQMLFEFAQNLYQELAQ